LTELGTPIVEWGGSTKVDAPLVVLLHGWGETEADMVALVPSLPIGPTYASVRAPHVQGRHYAWFAAGWPFDHTAKWFANWLDGVAPAERPVVLIGFSAGAAFAGGVVLLNPARYVGAAILCGTLPFDAGVPTPSGGLVGVRVFVAHSKNDPMIPRELLDRAWTYITEDSGACVDAVRYDSGHGFSGVSIADLAHWIAEIVVTRPS
jgi:phospholipase/carboxylesterase